jgi:putative peptide zinc metalloprotease protein
MLCQACHVHVRRDFPYCLHCGTLRKGARVAQHDAPVLRFDAPERRVALTAPTTTVGREPDNDVVVDDPSVSRHHARITRTAGGFHIEDLGSSNGTAVTPFQGVERDLALGELETLHDQTTIHVGDVPVLFEQVRSAAVGNRTMVRGTEHTVLGVAVTDSEPEAPTATEPLAAVPRRRSGWALKQLPDDRGTQRWVLRNTRTNAYLSLDEHDVFLWERLDGENSMRDLLFAYLGEYGELALPRIESTVRGFADAGLVRGLPGEVEEVSAWRRFGRALVKNLIRVEISIRRLDPVVERMYRGGGWRLFTPVAVFLLWALTLGGLIAFFRAGAEKQLFDFGGLGVVGAAAVVVGYVVSTTLHETAHALAVKSYGRRVNRGGFLLMMGMPFAFVDTSDMWFGSSWSRIVVAVSGPLTTAGIAGAASIAAITIPDPKVAGICYTLAAGLYTNTLFNLIPLVPLDGYQALADALRTPRLKEEAKAYFGGGFVQDLKSGRRPGAKQIGLVIFAVASMACLYAMLGLGVMTWNSRVGGLARSIVPQPWLTTVVILVLALVMFPVWFPRARTLIHKVRERRLLSRPDTSLVDPTDVISPGTP